MVSLLLWSKIDLRLGPKAQPLFLFKKDNYGIIKTFNVKGSNFRKFMFCTKCGTDNPDDAVYCKKCGGMIEAEEETRVAVRGGTEVSSAGGSAVSDTDGDEHEIFRIGPTMKFVYVGYAGAIVAALLLVGILGVIGLTAWIAVLLGLGMLLIPAWYHLKKKMVSYRLTDTTIEIDQGLISRTTRNVPLRRIQDVTVSASMMQRMLGFGDIIVDNAGEDGEKVVLDDIDKPREYADLMLKQMRRLDR